MKKLLLVVLLSIPFAAFPQNENKQLILKKTDSEIKIDGKIDAAWSEADSITDFFLLQTRYVVLLNH